MEPHDIVIRGARQHNLKDISVRLPRNKLVVVTGLSGSGKSSLVFDTLFAEGQRRYMESLSSYARQFLDRMQKPDVDQIDGLSPAIAIEQRTASTSPRSTIATVTEISDYMRLLFAAVGQPHHPVSGKALKTMTAQDIVDHLLAWPVGTRLILLAPVVRNQTGEFRDVLEKLRRDGFVRARVDGAIVEVENLTKLVRDRAHRIEAVVDRLVIREGLRQRLADSVELALKHGGGVVRVLAQPAEARGEANWDEHSFSNQHFDPETGEPFGEFTPKHFSFNSPLGACPVCHGLGSTLVLDPGLVVRDPSRSLDNGAIVPWRRGSKRIVTYYKGLLQAVAAHYGVDVQAPWSKIDPAAQQAILFGSGSEPVSVPQMRDGEKSVVTRPFEGVIPQLERLHRESESDVTRKRIETFMSRQPCRTCGGTRLKPEVLAVTVGGPLRDEPDQPRGRNLHEISRMSIVEARDFLAGIPWTETQGRIASDILKEILKRLKFLIDVGLGYLTLDRESGTLSGGEAQRIRLATQIGGGLTSVLYILDEPSIGLHQRDNDRLIETLQTLRDRGNSVIVVEHDEDTIRCADYVLDLGPGAGVRGGSVVAAGSPAEIAAAPLSITGQYLTGRRAIPVPRRRTRGTGAWLVVKNARENNLKGIDAKFPVGAFTCVTGVSGSGKSTLVNDILARALFRFFYQSKDRPGDHDTIQGLEHFDKAIRIDQTPLGRTPRSNPATYTGVFNLIRDLFAGLPTARVRGYGPGRFSLNVPGGRCETCQGDGQIKIPMHFLPDVYVPCEQCEGRRFNRDTLEVTYKGRNISDVLELTVDEALEFFRSIPQIYERLYALAQVGLGYLRLGQPADTLSGGEAQRVKLGAELSKKQTGRTIYLLDEPTTGLHFADVEVLVNVLLRLRESGNTVVVIEHNLDVIKCADHIVDLGPDGGDGGGRVIASGSPESVARAPDSVTGHYLKRKLEESGSPHDAPALAVG